ncbi:MAG: hypothetical protein GY708_10845 [Actinomycetia bacterium]|nr:hypothetical protein [Actinomycetes bacterium]
MVVIVAGLIVLGSCSPDPGFVDTPAHSEATATTASTVPRPSTTASPPSTADDPVSLTDCRAEFDVLARFDIDADGLDEFIVPAGGNTARFAAFLDDDCKPLPIVDPDDLLAVGFLYDAGGLGCAPTGCGAVIVCSSDTEPSQLAVSFRSPEVDRDIDPAEFVSLDANLVPLRVEVSVYEHIDGSIVLVERSVTIDEPDGISRTSMQLGSGPRFESCGGD